MRAGASELALVDDQIFVADWPAFKITFEDFARPRGVTRLSRKRRTGNVRRHPMVRHGSPGVICWGRLREPDIARIARELTAFECPRDGVSITDFSARRVHDISSAFHFRK